MRIISCDGYCEYCGYCGECELLSPFHQTLRKLNKELLTIRYELQQVKQCIQYSLHNKHLNYPVYIGYSLQELREHEQRLNEEYHETLQRKEDILKLLERRNRR